MRVCVDTSIGSWNGVRSWPATSSVPPGATLVDPETGSFHDERTDQWTTIDSSGAGLITYVFRSDRPRLAALADLSARAVPGSVTDAP